MSEEDAEAAADHDEQRSKEPTLEQEAQALVAKMRTLAPDTLRRHRTMRKRLVADIERQWRPALDTFDLLVIKAQTFLTDLSRAFENSPTAREDELYQALHAVASRSCQTANEVSVLLHAGYGPAAETRWRLMHELHVVAVLLRTYGQPMAKRYLDYEIVQKLRHLRDLENWKPRDEWSSAWREVDELLTHQYDRLKERYGDDPAYFEGDYGWAALGIRGKLSKGKITFRELERVAERSGLRQAYRSASDSVHGNILGAFAGGIETSEGIVLALGPSAAGLMPAGVSAADSLVQTMDMLLETAVEAARPWPETARPIAVCIYALAALLGDVFTAFSACRDATDRS